MNSGRSVPSQHIRIEVRFSDQKSVSFDRLVLHNTIA
jgi:hypothetical protein